MPRLDTHLDKWITSAKNKNVRGEPAAERNVPTYTDGSLLSGSPRRVERCTNVGKLSESKREIRDNMISSTDVLCDAESDIPMSDSESPGIFGSSKNKKLQKSARKTKTSEAGKPKATRPIPKNGYKAGNPKLPTKKETVVAEAGSMDGVETSEGNAVDYPKKEYLFMAGVEGDPDCIVSFEICSIERIMNGIDGDQDVIQQVMQVVVETASCKDVAMFSMTPALASQISPRDTSISYTSFVSLDATSTSLDQSASDMTRKKPSILSYFSQTAVEMAKKRNPDYEISESIDQSMQKVSSKRTSKSTKHQAHSSGSSSDQTLDGSTSTSQITTAFSSSRTSPERTIASGRPSRRGARKSYVGLDAEPAIEVVSEEEAYVHEESSDLEAEPSDDEKALLSDDSSVTESEPQTPVAKRQKLSDGKHKPAFFAAAEESLSEGQNKKLKAKSDKSGGAFVDSFKYKDSIDKSLPPIFTLDEIFEDLSSNAVRLGFEKFASRLKGSKLKIGTMCSGTESPILALMETQKCMKEHSIDFEIEHVFSCEIEPWKQAYIERNFAPPILFRDVCELIDEVATHATTAYGASVPIPHGLDLLIAGSSCVDYSALNSNKKKVTDGGESGDTLFGVLGYAGRFRPKIIIFENVSKKEPWEKLKKEFLPKHGYMAEYTNIDTKDYYIPHTRNRTYMMAVDTRACTNPKQVLVQWTELMKKFKRPASSPMDKFLLDDNDTLLINGLLDLKKPRKTERNKEVEWTRNRARHQKHRYDLGLGQGRPMTMWQEGGTFKVPAHFYQGWVRRQPDRVKDMIDLLFLRSMTSQRNFDQNFVSRSADLSQAIDRETDLKGAGLLGCLTPNGITFLSRYGRPVIGAECLIFQGLPVQKLLFARESQAELQNLAGNAMTSTVVGSAIMSALIAGFKMFTPGQGDAGVAKPQLPSISECRDMVSKQIYLNAYIPISKEAIVAAAIRSLRMCQGCEMQAVVTSNTLQKCRDCGYTSCIKCGVDGKHNYQPLPMERDNPLSFVRLMKRSLPMRMSAPNLSSQNLEKFWQLKKETASTRTKCQDKLRKAFGSDMRFSCVKRTGVWTVHYDSEHAQLHLVVSKNVLEWRLFAKPDRNDPGNSRARELFLQPILRMQPEGADIMAGNWEAWVYGIRNIDVTINASGSLVTSFRNDIGLTKSADTMVWNAYNIVANQLDSEDLDLDGTYKLSKCGDAAEGSLHIRQESAFKEKKFLFFDPSFYSAPADNTFVISANVDRLKFEEVRHESVFFPKSWRQPTYRVTTDAKDLTTELFQLEGSGNKPLPGLPTYSQTLQLNIAGRWVEAPECALTTKTKVPSVDAVHVTCGVNAAAMSSSCGTSQLVVEINATLPKSENEGWRKHGVVEIDELHRQNFFDNFASLTETTCFLNHLHEWMSFSESRATDCPSCAPAAPRIKWILSDGSNGKAPKLIPFEDRHQAATFERAVKTRPSAFVVQMLAKDDGSTDIKLAANPATLIHRAAAKMCGSHQDLHLSWRLATDYINPSAPKLPAFTLRNNVSGCEAAQPLGFLACHQLRPEQLRSLKWMLQQENEPTPFIEEEIDEALISRIGWRAEGRATRPVEVRGGVLADEVGYGKTITTLALIDTQRSRDSKAATDDILPGRIALKATLILVPDHLYKQWDSEITRFMKPSSKLNIFVLNSVQHLTKCTIADFRKADVIIAPWRIFDNDSYMYLVAHFAGMVDLPPATGPRATSSWYKTALADISSNVEQLRKDPSKMQEFINGKFANAKKSATEGEMDIPSKRLRGEAYMIAKAAKVAQKVGGGAKKQLGKKDNPYEIKPRDDVFGLNNLTRHPDYNRMKCPLLEIFEFSRLVVDEFAHSKGKESFFIPSLKAKSRWILSATPRMGNFADVKKMAGYMGINLGIDDISPGILRPDNVAEIEKDQTNAELFRSFKPPPSAAWHENRHRHAQKFLDHFVRRNIAELDAIPGSEHLRLVNLPAAQRVIYVELLMSLAANDFTLKTGRTMHGNDRAHRIEQLLGDSSTAGEALMRAASHFTLNNSGKNIKNASDACKAIIVERQGQYDALKADLYYHMRVAEWLHGNNDGMVCSQYEYWKISIKDNIDGDSATQAEILALIRKAESGRLQSQRSEFFRTQGELDRQLDRAKGQADQKRVWKDGPPVLAPRGSARNHLLRATVERLHVRSAELSDRTRSLRLLKNVRVIQKQATALLKGHEAEKHAVCSKCNTHKRDLTELVVLSYCGHVSCRDCLSDRSGECPSTECMASYHDYHMINASDFSIEEKSHNETKHFGAKLEQLTELIKKIPDNEQVLLFVQFSNFSRTVFDALEEGGIAVTSLDNDKNKSAETLHNFQMSGKDIKDSANKKKMKVLILNIGDASAAGSNLTNCNHIIFTSPYLADTSLEYHASMNQARGRARRFGQLKPVHIYHFLALKTIDVDTIQQRENKLLVNGKPDAPEFTPYPSFETHEYKLVVGERGQKGDFISPAHETTLDSGQADDDLFLEGEEDVMDIDE